MKWLTISGPHCLWWIESTWTLQSTLENGTLPYKNRYDCTHFLKYELRLQVDGTIPQKKGKRRPKRHPWVCAIYSGTNSQTLHVCHICLHWGGLRGQCRHIWHTWSVWDWLVSFRTEPFRALRTTPRGRSPVWYSYDRPPNQKHTQRAAAKGFWWTSRIWRGLGFRL